MTIDVAPTLHDLRVALAAGVGTAEGEHAAASVRQRLSTSLLSSWGALDRAARQIDVDTDILRFGPPLSHHVLLVLSMTRSGWTRLRVVERLAGNDLLTLATLMWRLDDIVWAVRAAAQARLMASIDAVPPATLARLMPVADVLVGRERIQGSVFLAALFARVRAAHMVDTPDQPIDVQRSLRRFWGLAVDGDDTQRLTIALQALHDGDIALALAVAQRVGPAMRPALAVTFAVHPVGAVRVRAAELTRPHPADAPLSSTSVELLLGLSIDTRADVRAAARRRLGNTTDEQRAVARDVVDGAAVIGPGVRLIGALASLAEIGRVEDFGRIARFFHDERVRVQAEAVRALVGSHASGGLEAYTDVLLDKLQSPAWRVGVEAARALAVLSPRSLPTPSLQALAPGLHPAVRRLVQTACDGGSAS